ncbi:WxL protein peptidoglycan domain-containing protein [Streptomyces sp. NPDC058611]|uniref:WxL protein peptidoglycan domain-containing protein n=1 Tax=unclassified Streptomyces TaxID=2593676 RepID=UPI00365E006D
MRSDRPPGRAPGTARAVAAALLAVVMTALLAGAPPAAGAARTAVGADGGSSWSVRPAGTADRAAFVMDSAPGTVVKDAVRISNLSDAPLSFQVYGSDAYNTPRDGALAYRQAGEAQSGLGGWLSLDTNALVIPPGRAADIPFTLNVPADATPGSHVGGIVALNNAVEQAGEAAGVDVGIQRAIAVRIQLTVEGPLTPGLAVRSVRVHHLPGGAPFAGARATLTYTVVNTGNAALRPTVSPRVSGLFGLRHSAFADRTLPLLLPGQSADLSADWPDAPGVDYLTATVRVTAPGLPATTAQSSRVAVSWPTLGAVAGLLAVLAVALGRLRRDRSGATSRTGAVS